MRYLLITFGVVALLVSCSKKSDNPQVGVPAGYATTPQPCNTGQANCVGTANWGNMVWNNGGWLWPYQYNPNIGFCGCPENYRPAYYHGWGVACAPNIYFSSFSLVYVGFNWWNTTPQNTHPVSTPVLPYQPNTCQSQASAGCDTLAPGSCPAGRTCQPAGGGSRIGFCI